jgi:TRAP-type C4-dicarboxylate transport system permease small subunit
VEAFIFSRGFYSGSSESGAIMIALERSLKRMSDGSYFIGKWLLVCTMFGIAIFVLLQVFFRYVLNQALLWPEELSRWLLVWTGYLGAGVAFKRQQHVALSFIIARFPTDINRITVFIGRLLVLVFFVFFTYFGMINMINSNQFSWALQVSVKWVMLSVPVCGVLLLIHLIYFVVEDISGFLGGSNRREEETSS